jgi:signal peptidase I
LRCLVPAQSRLEVSFLLMKCAHSVSRDRPIPSGRGRRISQEVVEELREELFAKGNRQWARVVSGSMAPLIQADDMVLLERVAPDHVRFGDVILFRRGEERVIHRVVGRRQWRGGLILFEKGDLHSALGLVRAPEVLGRVSAVQKSGITVDLMSGWGRIVQLGLACTSVGVWRAKRAVGKALAPLGCSYHHLRLGLALDGLVTLVQNGMVRSLRL